VGLLLLAIASFLVGGVIAFRRQGKPVGVQVVLGLAAAALIYLALQTEPFR
jgi:hypothetical protein